MLLGGEGKYISPLIPHEKNNFDLSDEKQKKIEERRQRALKLLKQQEDVSFRMVLTYCEG